MMIRPTIGRLTASRLLRPRFLGIIGMASAMVALATFPSSAARTHYGTTKDEALGHWLPLYQNGFEPWRRGQWQNSYFRTNRLVLIELLDGC
jgi:hypothetical protein